MKSSVDKADNQGCTVLHHLFRQNRDRAAAAHRYTSRRMLGLLGLLLEKGASLYQRDRDGNLVTHAAAAAGYHTELLHLTSDCNVHPNLLNYRGENITHCAVMSGDLRTVQVSLQVGGSKSTVSTMSEMPVHVAKRLALPKIQHAFVEAKTKKEEDVFSAVDSGELTALQQVHVNRHFFI